ncbi:dipeptidyl aminopeptidase/acylaminoacyl peptidase [Friedmanniella endophytica]|uniref:Dipeptidyl aminopeptidase/acylaminoacyl peptidase n=1 Tax=Microlunatus kandeliicorticis TaxID=1759536 RepID=A0A7W3P5Q1_9ACTN|nr:S9 family peptidase [Microlunatus kandeliicorticis]MBA8794100.1 dipeptidyl aminopeptidase/acylaminoacyl peptidase [Microlunatus kandeliicorticis]
MDATADRSPASGPGRLTPDLISTTWEPTVVRLSRDGGRVVWAAAPHGRTGEHPESGLWTASVADPDSARRLTRGGNDTAPRWSPDGSRIAFLSDRAERGTAGLYLIDPDGGEAEPLVVRSRAVETIAWSPDGSALALAVPADPDDEDQRREKERDDAIVSGERLARNQLLTVPVTGGDPVVLPVGDLHPTVLAWSPDGSRIAFIARPEPELDLSTDAAVYLVAADPGQPGGTPQVERVGAAPWAEDLCWTADGTELLVLGRQATSLQSSATVWTMPAAAGSTGRVLGPRIEEPLCALGVRSPGPGAPAPAVITIADGIETRLEWRGDGPDATTTLWESDGEILDVDVAMTADGPVLAALVHAGSGPLEVWAGVPGDLRQLSDHHAAWSGITFGAVQELISRTDDGWELHSVVVLPTGGRPGPHPTVVLPHGGPYWRMARNLHCAWHDWSQLLAAAGYAVLLPNFRGGSGHGNAFASAVLGDPGVEFDDVEAVIASAVEAGITDPERLGIGGWSNGGFLTAWAVTHSTRFRAAVMGAGVSSWPAMVMTSDVPTFSADVAGAAPWSDQPGHSLEHSPIARATQVTTPLLMLHGQEDVRVPLSQSIGMQRALRGRDLPVQLVVYPREPHGIEEHRHQVDLMTRVVDWFTTHLPV